MESRLVWIKIKQRLNKLDSNDYDNIQCWQIMEAFNKAQRDWCRRQLHGMNQVREGMEQTTRRVDDLQILLTDINLTGTNKDTYFESNNFPSDYFEFNRVSASGSTPTCKNKKLMVRFIEEGNVDEWLRDSSLNPSMEWGETFNTLKGNQVLIYHSNKFTITNPILNYYRLPKDISLDGCEALDGTQLGNINPEFKDDIVELLIDEAAAILSGDIESWNVMQNSKIRKEENN